ncbi:MAG: hypothetical protein ACYSWW_28970 [Planctomycetota bacterium]
MLKRPTLFLCTIPANLRYCPAPPGDDFTAISAGQAHALALRVDGSIVGWGRNDFGQATVPEGTGFLAVAAGDCASIRGWDSGRSRTQSCDSTIVSVRSRRRPQQRLQSQFSMTSA